MHRRSPTLPPDADRVAPPAWSRPLVLVLLGVLAAYQIQGVLLAAAPAHLPQVVRLPRAGWFAWSMFSTPGSRHRKLDAQVVRAGAAEILDLAPLFPTRWESGIRFERSEIYRSARVRRVAAAICRRVALAEPGRSPPQQILLTEVTWKRRPGRRPGKPGPKAERTELLRWTCERHG
jgi:hypothetical protein